ncbi:MAG: hypothetical protein Fur0021_35370 [Candidatus Promineifilaceae bacterium]
MSDLFAQAQAAVREGNAEKAHVLLAQLLKEDRRNVAAWYLLSTITPSAEQKAIFLQKVLKLAPNHQAAAAQLSQLQQKTAAPAMMPAAIETAAPAARAARPISQDADDFEAQASGETLPPWLAGEESGVEVGVPMTGAAVTPAPALEIPDWLQEMPAHDWEKEREEAIAQARAAATQPAPPPAAPTPKPAARPSSSNTLLTVLVVAAVVVFVILVYLLITLGPTLF